MLHPGIERLAIFRAGVRIRRQGPWADLAVDKLQGWAAAEGRQYQRRCAEGSGSCSGCECCSSSNVEGEGLKGSEVPSGRAEGG